MSISSSTAPSGQSYQEMWSTGAPFSLLPLQRELLLFPFIAVLKSKLSNNSDLLTDNRKEILSKK